MKNQNKKGFTLVELVIVIAVIAILAGVLIGTFATVISRANQSKAVQEWKAAVDEAYVDYVADNHVAPASVKVVGKSIEFGNGSFVDGFVALNGDVFVELDANNFVYLLWDADPNGSTYSVATSNTGYDTEADAKSIVETFVKAQLKATPGATKYTLTGGNTVPFTNISFSTDTGTDLSATITLGTFSGKTWKATFTETAGIYSVEVSEYTPAP